MDDAAIIATDGPGSAERRESVLDAALGTFARFGYRKTSMDDIAADAQISRPGLYFLFSSKSALFRAATERAIQLDLAAAERALDVPDRPLAERLVDAFDSWAGRYIGPLADVQSLVEDNPDLLGPAARSASDRFHRMLLDALVDDPAQSQAIAQTLVSVSIGIKHQVADRQEYLTRMRAAVALVLA